MTRPHILENICLSLDYETFKNCLEINEAWKTVLTASTLQKKAKFVFQKEIMEDEKKLRIASMKGKIECVSKLVSIGMLDIDCVTKRGATSLYWAAKKGHEDIVQMLLEGGADPNKVTKYKRLVPLSAAATYSHKGVVQLLLDRGADPNKEDRDGDTPLPFHVS